MIFSRPRAARTTFLASLALLLGACGEVDQPVFAILSAFPAELDAVLARAKIEQTVAVDGHLFRLGWVGGTRVVVGMTGIGLGNAEATMRTLLENFAVNGVVVSGVAGSFLRIGDVAVPTTWAFTGEDERFAVHAPWLKLATDLAEPGVVPLEECTIVPGTIPISGALSGERVCLGFEPIIAVGGAGESSDPFGSRGFVCTPGGNDVFGCDLAAPAALERRFSKTGVALANVALASVDQETAAIARQAVAHGVPFIAFRAVSDGAEDPLDLPGFPSQFFVYYRLAAENAAAAAVAFVQHAG